MRCSRATRGTVRKNRAGAFLAGNAPAYHHCCIRLRWSVRAHTFVFLRRGVDVVAAVADHARLLGRVVWRHRAAVTAERIEERAVHPEPEVAPGEGQRGERLPRPEGAV